MEPLLKQVPSQPVAANGPYAPSTMGTRTAAPTPFNRLTGCLPRESSELVHGIGLRAEAMSSPSLSGDIKESRAGASRLSAAWSG